MAETEVETPSERCERVVPIRVTKLCAVCGGDMKFTGSVLASYPAKYTHVCSVDQAHGTKNFDQPYPAVVFDRCCEGGPQWGHSIACPRNG